MPLLENYLQTTPETKRSKAAIAYLAALDHLGEAAPLVQREILAELKDERSHLKLIASENFSSLAVQLSMGNLLTDKYSEGFPRHRFYAGCEHIDSIEEEAANLLKTIFGSEHAYVQPHSGADANLVAMWSVLVQKIENKAIEKLQKKSLNDLTAEEYETIRQEMGNQRMMGMSLNSGGHLTHGYRHNISSKIFQAFTYDVDPKTELLDYTALKKQVEAVRPLLLIAGYSAYPRRLNFAKLREIADSVGAVLMVDMAHFSGLVAGKVFVGEENPAPYAHIITSTTHKTLRGPRGGFILCKQEFADIINKGCPLVLGGPLPHVMAAKAVAFREANTPDFCTYAKKIVNNAQTLAEALRQKGVRLVTGGTDNHLMVLDVSSFGITGKQAENALRAARLTVNRNTIPFDPQGPWYTSGVRLGTPALTTLGMGAQEMVEIADIIVEILKETRPAPSEKEGKESKAQAITNPKILKRAHQRVEELLSHYPLYPEIAINVSADQSNYKDVLSRS